MTSMQVVSYSAYGPPSRLQLTDHAIPQPGPDQVLLKVGAVALNASDVEFLTAHPAYIRMWGLTRPKVQVLGSDICGSIVSCGRGVEKWQVGDRVVCDVFGKWGGLAEYVVASADALVRVPDSLSDEQAAALPQSGVLAHQVLLAGRSPKAQRILINGAGGGSGTFAVQLARHFGAAHIVAVDRAHKLAELRALGAHEAIDFEHDDPLQLGPYDRIVDFVGSRCFADNRRALAPNGQYWLVGGSIPRLLSTLLLGSWHRLFSEQRLRVFVHEQSAQALQQLVDLCAEGAVRPIVGRLAPLSEAPSAFTGLMSGQYTGKVVLSPTQLAEPHESSSR